MLPPSPSTPRKKETLIWVFKERPRWWEGWGRHRLQLKDTGIVKGARGQSPFTASHLMGSHATEHNVGR